ncbi:MAG: hypothetical protein JAY72_19430 [Candidatus Thiodiazotropha endolucinida]|nr:hypothetical protein [Candidatus Thiodiazotropha taylori]MCW4323855.1 hypothetical protein [Candidatus Thiodiazotropha taylori]
MKDSIRVHLTQWLQALGAIASVVIATVALYVAYKADLRSIAWNEEQKLWADKQFALSDAQQKQIEKQIHQVDEQIRLSRSVAAANIRPILYIKAAGYTDHGGFVLENHGLGTAVIKNVVFSLNGNCSSSLVRLFAFSEPPMWEDFFQFIEPIHYLKPGNKINIAIMSVKSLEGYVSKHPNVILQQYYDQWEGLSARIEYEDLFGNTMPSLEQSWSAESNNEIKPIPCVNI